MSDNASENSASDSRSGAQREPLDLLAEEFVQRYRRGERPSVKEFARQHPQLAEQIEQIFPALVVMEDLAPAEGELELPELPPDGSTPSLPEALGDYRILREIGRGGMGVVYEAEQQSLGRRVALKVLSSRATLDAKQKKRFEREAKAAARLHHTNIVPVFGIGEHAGMQYYAMQFIAGLGLDGVLAELKSMRERGSGTFEKAATPFPADAQRRQQRDCAASVAQSLFTGQFSRAAAVADADEDVAAVGRAFRNTSVPVDRAPSQQRTDPTTVCTTERPLPDDTASHRLSETMPVLGTAGLSGTTGDLSGSRSSRNVYWRSVARIGIQVAHALQYAHEAGIVHRDIKPSNLLLDTHGTVWVTDFGLAKAQDEDELTGTGDVIGTLRYMPPEAFDACSDERSDLYSLGLTLYELLCLQPGFDETNRHRLIRQLTTNSPERLRRIDPHIPRDLETIVHKSIEREPGHRYQTAEELADDLQRFLNDEPVRARQTPLTVRCARWCRRNPMAATVAALLLVCLMAAGTAAKFFLVQADENAQLAQQEHVLREQADGLRRQAEAALAEAQQQHARAETNFAKARSAVDDFFTTVSQSRLLNVPGMQPLRRQLLKQALGYYQDFVRQRSGDPELRKELANAQLGLARIARELGLPEQRMAFREALTLYRELHREHREDAEMQHGLATCYYLLDSYEQAIDEWEALLRANPDNPTYKQSLGDAFNSLAVRHSEEENYAASLDLHQRALFLRLELLQHEPENPQIHADLGSTLNNIGVLLARQERYDEALDMYRQSVEHDQFAFERDPGVVLYGTYLALTCSNIAHMEERAGRVEEAGGWFRRAAEVRMRLASTNPDVAALQSSAYDAWRLLAAHLNSHQQPAEAANALRRAGDVLQRLPNRTGTDLFNLARVYALASGLHSQQQGDQPVDIEQLAEGQQLSELAIKALQRAVDAGFSDRAQLENESDLNPLHGHPEFQELLANLDALAERDPAKLDETEVSPSDDRADVAEVQYFIGILKTLFDEPAAARNALAQSITAYEELLRHRPDDAASRQKLARSHRALAQLAWKTGDYGDAKQHWHDVFSTLETNPDGGPNPELSQANFDFATLLARAGLLDEALPFFTRAIELDPDGGDRRRRGLCLAYLEAGETEAAARAAWEEVERTADHKHGGAASSAVLLPLLIPQQLDDNQIKQLLKFAETIWNRGRTGAWTTRTYGLATYRAGRFEQTAQLLQSTADKDASIQCDFIRAMALHRLGRLDAARQLLEATVKAQLERNFYAYKPAGTGELKQQWWLWFIANRLRQEAETLIVGAPSPADPFVTLHRARNSARLGNLPRADELFDEAVALAPDSGLVRVIRVRFLAEAGQLDRARAEFAEARAHFLASDPEEQFRIPHQWRQLGTTARLCGQPEAAAEAFAEAVRLQSQAIRDEPSTAGLRHGLKLMMDDLAAELAGLGDEDRLLAVHDAQRKLYEQLALNPLVEMDGHTSPYVWSVSLLHDGRHALSAGHDGHVRLRDLLTGDQLRTFKHGGPVSRVVCLPHSEQFLTAAYDMTIRLWDIETGELVRTLDGHTDHIWALAASPDGTRVLSGGEDQTLRLWNPASGELLETIEVPGSVRCVTFAPDGRRALSGFFVADSFDISLWDVQEGRRLHELAGHEQSVYAMDFAPDGEQAVTGDRSGLIVLWDVAHGKELRRWTEDWGEVRAAVFLPDGNRIVVGTGDGSLLLLDTLSGEIQQRLRGPVRHNDLALLPSGYHVLTGDADSKLRLWSMPLLAPPNKAMELIGQQLDALEHAPELRQHVAEQAVVLDAIHQQLVSTKPDDSQLQIARAMRLVQRQDWDAAADVLDQARLPSEPPGVVTTKWWISGPYPGDRHQSRTFFNPAENLDPFRPVDNPSQTPFKLRWQGGIADDNGRLRFESLVRDASDSSHSGTYALLRLYAQDQATVLLQASANDLMAFWLNGKEIGAPRVTWGTTVPIELDLKPGWNTLLVKVTNWITDWWLQYDLVDRGSVSEDQWLQLRTQAAVLRGDWQAAGEYWTALTGRSDEIGPVLESWDSGILKRLEKTESPEQQRLLLTALLASRSGDRERALQTYSDGIRGDQQPFLRNARLADLRAHVEQELNIEAELTAAIEQDPDQPERWRERAYYYTRRGNAEQAVQDFQAALERSAPAIVEPGWSLSDTSILCGASAVAFDAQNREVCVGTRNSGGTDGIFRIDAHGNVTRIADGERVSGLVVHPDTGDIFFSEPDGGQVFRINRQTRERELWISRFGAGDRDPMGMAVVRAPSFSPQSPPGSLLVIDCGWGDADFLYGVSHRNRDESMLLHRDSQNSGPLIHAVDIAVTDDGHIYVVDTGESDAGLILRYDANSGFTPLVTSAPLETPTAIATDPLTGDLLILDVNKRALLRVNPDSGMVTTSITNLAIAHDAFSGVTVSPDGNQLFVAATEAAAVLTFTRSAAKIEMLTAQRLANEGQWERATKILDGVTGDASDPFVMQSGWWVSGPYPELGRGQTHFAPSENLDPFQPIADPNTAPLLPRWQVALPRGNRLDFNRLFSDKTRTKSASYVLTRIYSSVEHKSLYRFHADDRMRIWMNGREIELQTAKREIPVQIELEPGWNSVLVKVWNAYGDYFLEASEIRRGEISEQDWLRFVARAAVLRGDAAAALSPLNTILSEVPDDIECLTLRAEAHLYAGDRQAAQRDVTKLARLTSDTDILTSTAEVCERFQMWEQAAELYSQLLRHDPNQADTYYRRSKCFRLSNRQEEALADIQTALSLESRPEYFIRRARLYFDRDDFTDAIRDCDEAHRHGRREFWLFAVRGRSHIALGNLEAGLEDLNHTDVSHPHYVFVAQARREAQETLDAREPAEELEAELTLALEQTPNDVFLLERLAALHNREQDWLAAVDTWSRLIELAPDDSRPWFQRALIRYPALGELDQALDDMNHSIELVPAPVTLAHRAWLHIDKGNHERALADCDQAYQRGLREPYLFARRSHARFELGDLAGAVRDATEAVRLNPEDEYSQHRLQIARQALTAIDADGAGDTNSEDSAMPQ